MINESIRDVLHHQLLESSACPVRTQLYGGMPAGGGYGSSTEFEIGAQRAAEAAHCLLGSLGKLWDRQGNLRLRYELDHIDEENGIIQGAMKEYSRQLYVDRFMDPTKDYKPEYQAERRKYVENSVKSIRTNSPKLRDKAYKNLMRLKRQKDLPKMVFQAAQAAYLFLIRLAEAMEHSVKDYPKKVENPYRDAKLKQVAGTLDFWSKQILKEGDRRRAAFLKDHPPLPTPEPVRKPIKTRDKKPGESDIDYTMYLLGMKP